MGKPKPKATFKPGDPFFIKVDRPHIDGSDPCNKDNCMVNRGFIDWFASQYGDRNPKAKSTNHGLTFELNGRKYTAVFDTKTAFRIFNYDAAFRKTHSKDKARSAVRPFTVRMMIEASTAITKWPKMSEATKKKLREMPRQSKKNRPATVRSQARQLSL